MSATKKIEVKNVSYIYSPKTPFEKTALDDVSMDINDGEFVAIIGQTGSGKSTIMKHLNGLYAPTKGQILFEGKNIHEDKKFKKKIHQKVGLVFQYPEHQLFDATVLKDVCFGPLNIGYNEVESQNLARNALKLIGINSELYNKSPFELSGGQRRRVAIAGVLAMGSDVLALDEPSAGLDPSGRNELYSFLKKIQKEEGKTIVLVSHSMEEVAYLADKIYVFDKGKIVLQGKNEDIFKNPDMLQNIGLNVPKVSLLNKALKEKGIYLKNDVYTVEEATNELYEILKDYKSGEQI